MIQGKERPVSAATQAVLDEISVDPKAYIESMKLENEEAYKRRESADRELLKKGVVLIL